MHRHLYLSPKGSGRTETSERSAQLKVPCSKSVTEMDKEVEMSCQGELSPSASAHLGKAWVGEAEQ